MKVPKVKGGELSVRSNAKINLTLHIFPKDNSGFHPLKSIFQEISLHDTLSVTIIKTHKPHLAIISKGIKVSTNEDNILFNVFKQFDDIKHSYTITLNKRIPLGSGMGGASSNAAAFLKILNSIEKLHLSDKHLCSIASKIGSDISFFINGKTQFIEGIGNILSPCSIQIPQYYLLIHPYINCCTKTVYNTFDTLPYKDSITYHSQLGHNDLLVAVLTEYPAMKDIYYNLQKITDLPVHLTGSGSTFYLFHDDYEKLELEKSRITNIFSNFLVEIVESIM